MSAEPLVGIVMGSRSDYAVMRAAVEMLREFGVAHEARVVSAHRTPDLLFEYAEAAAGRGLRVIIAGAGGAAHLPGMMAAKTVVPVLGVPIAATALQGMDALLSIAQMPKGVPVGTMAIGASGAANAALLAVAMLATGDAALRARCSRRASTGWTTLQPRLVHERGGGETGEDYSSGRDHRDLRWGTAWPHDRDGRAWHGIPAARARS
jgi:5-(carboxyamino)imidazole ribonucleotide mutase